MRKALQLFGDWNRQVATWFYNIKDVMWLMDAISLGVLREVAHFLHVAGGASALPQP